ncbi:probable serine/threonine-protein kinase DDB_G0284251 isoform X2 [Oscarella lobularis]|uniref:probable serine/threonine-protein kinase DDB_G0284251 isoform X2 n=1 Tax=Oscarella lobularis TaxID=121494 RepID=UPI00331408F5
MSDSRRQLLQKRRSSLVLEGCPITDRDKDEAHSTEVLFRWNATWQNNVVTATQLPTDDDSEVRCIVDQMKSLRHPNVLQFWGVADSVEVGVHIVTEHLKEDLNQLLKRLPNLSFPNRVNGLKQLANALSYLHSREISHGNLTSQSIFATDEGRVLKLAYFGLARFSQKQEKSAACSDDIHSYGLIMQIMLCGNEDLTKFQEVMKKYQKTHKGVADELTSLCRKCLEKDPSKRPNARKVAQQAPTVKTDSETSIELQMKDASNAAQAQVPEYFSTEMSASKSKDDAEMTTLREKAKTLQEEKKKLESQLAANKNLFEKAKEDSCNELEKLKKEKMSLKQNLKTIEEDNKKIILQQRKTFEEKTTAERKCGEMENLVEKMKTYNRNQEEALTEAKTKLESCKKSIVAKDTAFQQQKTLLEETTKRLQTAIESLSEIQSKASSTLSEIQDPARKQPSLTEDPDQEGKGSGKKTQQEMQSTKLYVCQTCSTPLVDTSLVVHSRVRATTSVSILSDYKKTSKAVKAMLENAMKS